MRNKIVMMTSGTKKKGCAGLNKTFLSVFFQLNFAIHQDRDLKKPQQRCQGKRYLTRQLTSFQLLCDYSNFHLSFVADLSRS